jgi:rubrerythrin
MIPQGCSPVMAPAQPELAGLLIEAMKDERADRAKYGVMKDMAKDDKIKRQINFAYEDEGKHYRMFQQILYMLTGRMVDIPLPKAEIDNLKKAVEASIDGELEAVELYRKIQSMLPSIGLRDMLFEIITDEQEHAIRFTYLYSLLED